MTEKPSLKKNYIYRLIYEALSLALPFITVPYISRVLEANGVGRVSFAESVTAYFIMFCALGKNTYGTRIIAVRRDDRRNCSKSFLEIELLSFICLLVLLIPWSILIFNAHENRLLYIAMTPCLVAAMLDISWFYTGIERMGIIAGISGIVKLAGVILMFVLVKSSGDIALYCLINSSVLLISNLLMWLFLPKYLCSIKGIKLTPFSHLRETLIYFIPAVATSVYLVLDKTLIGLITKDEYQNGYYEQASKVINVGKAFAFLVFNSVMTARMSYLFSEKDHDKIKEMISASMDFILLFVYGAVFGLLGISHDLVPLLFGEGYEAVEGLIYLMLPLILIIAVSNCLESHYYVPSGQRGKSNRYLIAGAVLNFCLNLCLIPHFAAAGAVAASVAAELLITILYMSNCAGIYKPAQILASSFKRIAAGICMAGIVYVTGRMAMAKLPLLFIQLAAGVVSYILILLIMKDKGVMRILKSLH
ncbi:MAG: oligosaccharide flippase family protein [Lachnospiraceae bacterium]|nr:oligosaccharide flippase family protein [Lachnospiraceae bacterium]